MSYSTAERKAFAAGARHVERRIVEATQSALEKAMDYDNAPYTWLSAPMIAHNEARSVQAVTILAAEDAINTVDPKLGKKVNKVSGYRYPGEVVAVFNNKAGETRFVVEATGEEYAGMLHIFNQNQLSFVDNDD
jgi:hypothetical protein